jgi:hypothetical protein
VCILGPSGVKKRLVEWRRHEVVLLQGLIHCTCRATGSRALECRAASRRVVPRCLPVGPSTTHRARAEDRGPDVVVGLVKQPSYNLGASRRPCLVKGMEYAGRERVVHLGKLDVTTRCVLNASVPGSRHAQMAGVVNDPHALVASSQPSEDLPRPIRRAVVHADKFKRHSLLAQHGLTHSARWTFLLYSGMMTESWGVTHPHDRDPIHTRYLCRAVCSRASSGCAALDDRGTTAEEWRWSAREVLASTAAQEWLLEGLLTLPAAKASSTAPTHRPLGRRRHGAPCSVRRCGVSRAARRDNCRAGAARRRRASRRTTGRQPGRQRDRPQSCRWRHPCLDGDERGHSGDVGGYTGSAIPPADIGRLPQPFTRLDLGRTHHKDSLGLGLTIVSAIVAAHGAIMSDHAAPAGGLPVTVTFPSRSVDSSAPKRSRAQRPGRAADHPAPQWRPDPHRRLQQGSAAGEVADTEGGRL